MIYMIIKISYDVCRLFIWKEKNEGLHDQAPYFPGRFASVQSLFLQPRQIIDADSVLLIKKWSSTTIFKAQIPGKV